MPETVERRPLTIQIDASDYDALLALCDYTGRSLSSETAHAIRRHLEHPPEVTARPLPTASTADVPRRKPGRPKK